MSNPYHSLDGRSSDGLADILERVLDKGVVIAGDIKIGVRDIELLTLKIRLLVASADTAQQMGIDWWQHDPFLSSQATGNGSGSRSVDQTRQELEARLSELERQLAELPKAGEAQHENEGRKNDQQ